MKPPFAKPKGRILSLLRIKSAKMNNFRMNKIMPLLCVMALIILAKTSCIKFPGGIPPPTNFTCDITEFKLKGDFGSGKQADYFQLMYDIMMGDVHLSVLVNATNIQYNSSDQPILAQPNGENSLTDSLYIYHYDSQNRLSDLRMVELRLDAVIGFRDSLFLYRFGYKPGSTLPDSLYINIINKGDPSGTYTPYQIYEYDAFNRLTKVTRLTDNIYHRLVYGAGGDLQAVYEGVTSVPGDRILLLFQSYDHKANCMRTNPVWTILSGMYSINNPTLVTFYQYLEGSLLYSKQITMGYTYGALFNNLPTGFYNVLSPAAGAVPDGTINYSCGSIIH
jgi:hypothetical protein